MADSWDVVVVGAGVGGLSAAVLLAQEGMKTLVVEKDDRVGGRALSLRGEEVGDRGADWYRRLLGGQYSYLIASEPSLDEMVDKGVLDGYILDLGYHAVSVAGEGYFAMLRDLIGGYGDRQVIINPCLTGSWIDGQFYEESPLSNMQRVDDKLYAEFKRIGKRFFDFFGPFFDMTPQQLKELDSLSLHEHLVKTGFAESKIIYDYLRCFGTLFTTINDPNDISMGDMTRYALQVIMPAVMKGGAVYVGGFTENGIMTWSEAIADKFIGFGGEIRLDTSMKSIEVEGDQVKGVTIEGAGGEEFIPARRVVFNIPIQELFKYIDERVFPVDFTARVKSLYGYGSLSPYIGLTGLPVPEEHAKRLMKTPCVVPRSEGFDWDVYMAWNIQSYIEPGCAPEGKHLFTAYLPLTEKESHDRELVMKVVRAVPDFLEEVYPGFKDYIEWELYPVCVKLEGVAKSVTQAGSLKPDVKAPGLEGLFFAGDTARGYGVAMDCACSSGILSAAAITGNDYGVA